jgi:hypothetical protein
VGVIALFRGTVGVGVIALFRGTVGVGVITLFRGATGVGVIALFRGAVGCVIIALFRGATGVGVIALVLETDGCVIMALVRGSIACQSVDTVPILAEESTFDIVLVVAGEASDFTPEMDVRLVCGPEAGEDVIWFDFDDEDETDVVLREVDGTTGDGVY